MRWNKSWGWKESKTKSVRSHCSRWSKVLCQVWASLCEFHRSNLSHNKCAICSNNWRCCSLNYSKLSHWSQSDCKSSAHSSTTLAKHLGTKMYVTTSSGWEGAITKRITENGLWTADALTLHRQDHLNNSAMAGLLVKYMTPWGKGGELACRTSSASWYQNHACHFCQIPQIPRENC